ERRWRGGGGPTDKRGGWPPVRYLPIHRGQKESPGRAGALGDETSRGRTLDAPILSQGTHHARRGSRKRPGPPRGSAGQGLAQRAGRRAWDAPLGNAALSRAAEWPGGIIPDWPPFGQQT